MTLSVNNNSAAQLALQNLDATTQALSQSQQQVDSSLAVASPQQNSAVWAIAQGQRGQIGALTAVTSSLNRASSIADVGVSAGQTVSDLLNQIKTTVLSATDTSLNTSERSSLNTNFQSLLGLISNAVSSAGFDGANILDGSSSSLQFLSNASGSQQISLSGVNLSLGGPLVPFTQTSTINTATAANAVLNQLSTAIPAVNTALSQLGAQSTQIGSHSALIGQYADTLNTSVGDLVDANLSSESARLQALQVQQQLSIQTLQLANSTPGVILSIFKGG
jgi:flagellin